MTAPAPQSNVKTYPTVTEFLEQSPFAPAIAQEILGGRAVSIDAHGQASPLTLESFLHEGNNLGDRLEGWRQSRAKEAQADPAAMPTVSTPRKPTR